MKHLEDEASVARRVSGLVIAGFDGTTPGEAPVDELADAAGIILFGRNAVEAPQTASLVREFQDAAARAHRPPLLVAIDEEGGTVSRIGRFGVTMPSAMALGATGDPGRTRAVYRAIGEQLAWLGVNVDLAPVADVNTSASNPVIGVRSFGGPAVVASHIKSAVEGLHDAGVAATAKHFPGHGDASVDSHVALPVIPHDIERLRSVELPPFRAAIEAGVDLIMTAHVALPAIDPSGTPATLSDRAIDGLLRRELGFDGVVITDCLQMQAIAGRYAPGEAAVRAIEAGADLIAFSSSLADVRAAIAALARAVVEGRLTDARIERSLARVDRLRRRLASDATRRGTPDRPLDLEAPRAAAREAARDAVTLVRDPRGVLPLRLAEGQRLFLVQFQGARETPVEDTAKQTSPLGKMLARGPARVQEQTRTLDPAGHEYKQLLMASGAADAIVAVTRRAWAHPLQAQAVGDLELTGKPLVVIAAREPYDASVAPADATVIASYGDDAATMEAVAEVILGDRQARGTLPVEIAQPQRSGENS